MARPSKNAAIDFSTAHDLTYGLLDRAICPSEKSYVLLKDADKKGLRARITPFSSARILIIVNTLYF